MRVWFILLLGRLTYHNHLSTFSRFVCYKFLYGIFGGMKEEKKEKNRGGGKAQT